MSSVVTERVQKKLEEFVADPSQVLEGFNHIAYLRTVATELNALPMLLDMSGCYALRLSGEIISVGWDDFTEVQIENDARICNPVLFQGSRKYPGLEMLNPERPPEASECSSCTGTDILELTRELGKANLLCHCGGLGWVPAGTEINAVATK